MLFGLKRTLLSIWAVSYLSFNEINGNHILPFRAFSTRSKLLQVISTRWALLRLYRLISRTVK